MDATLKAHYEAMPTIDLASLLERSGGDEATLRVILDVLNGRAVAAGLPFEEYMASASTSRRRRPSKLESTPFARARDVILDARRAHVLGEAILWDRDYWGGDGPARIMFVDPHKEHVTVLELARDDEADMADEAA